MIAASDRRSLSPWRAAGLFAGRDWFVARSYKAAFVMSIFSVVMSLITFRFISKLVGSQVHVSGDYFSFVVVGLAMSQILEGAVTAPSAGVRQEQVQGTLEVVATTPMSPASLASGWIAFPLMQATVTAAAMIGIAALMGLRFSAPNWPPAVLALLLAGACFAAIGIAVAALVLVIQQAQAVTRWLIAGMGMLSGVFFPLSLFPRWMQILALGSPLTHELSVIRGSLLQGHSFTYAKWDLLALFAFAAIALPLSVVVLSAAMRRARAKGTISTY